MAEKELISTVFQISQCYSKNRTSTRCVDLVVSGWTHTSEKILSSRFPTYQNWKPKVHFSEAPYKEAYDEWHLGVEKPQLIYLTPDSPNVLETLTPGHMYVIGGITDKNRYRRLCLEKAELDGVKTARLPIDGYINMPSRKVLSINTVFDVLLRYLNSGSWASALMESIPRRKNPSLKKTPSEDASGASDT